MMQRHLEHGILRQLIEPGPLLGGLDDQRQNVEAAAPAAPAEPVDRRGEARVLPVSPPRTVRSSGARVPAELRVPHPCERSARRRGREHGDRRTDLAVVGGLEEVADQLREDVVGVSYTAPLADPPRSPRKPADAPAGVTPGEPGTELQFLWGVRVRSGPREFTVDLRKPWQEALARAHLAAA